MRYHFVFNDLEKGINNKMYIFFSPEIIFLKIYSEEIIKDIHKDVATIKFAVPLFIGGKTWKQF